MLSSLASRGPTCYLCRLRGISGLHTSAVTAGAFKTRRGTKGSSSKGNTKAQFKSTSRTRLVKDLRPEDKGGKYEVAKPTFKKKPGQNAETSSTTYAAQQKAEIEALLDEEFDRSTPSTEEKLPDSFSSPPLLPALVQSMTDVLGQGAKPAPIQALALKHLMSMKDAEDWQEFLLASETGSGKSFAYLLPLIQYLKETEGTASDPRSRLLFNPRALVLAPTHELTRQLSVFAKSLIHYAKLRVLCASRANVRSTSDEKPTGTARHMRKTIEALEAKLLIKSDNTDAQSGAARPVDLLVSTPVKALEMVRGWGWDKVGTEEAERDGKIFRPGKPELGLKRIECVVVDEADILFDPDFKDTLLALLSDISSARGHPISPDSRPIKYPFHLILTSATIPSSLSTYLSTHHPALTRLASPRLHSLPETLHLEHVGWTGGNRNADIEKRLRRVWAEDALRGPNAATGRIQRSRVLIFCNRSTRVEALGEFLTERGIPNITLTSDAPSRARGSNRHLAGFLKDSAVSSRSTASGYDKNAPLVLITTSLLSRGLDFSPSVQHVFVVDSPRNMIDFLHRAGRSGRAGRTGKVVVFGKLKGRGSDMDKDLKRKVRALAR